MDGTSWACIPIDREGKVLYPTMIWLDRRASEEAQWMKNTIGEEKLIQLSGNPVDPSYLTPKILWLKNHHPEVYRQTYRFLQSNSFIVYRLTNILSQDYSQGYALHFFNIRTGKLDEVVASQLGIDMDLIPTFYESHDIVGGVTKEVARLTGLVEGTPVVAGGLDAACCTLGAGVAKEGQTQEQGGQAGGMSIALSTPLIHEKLILGRHVVPNMWLLQGGTTGGGGTLNWFNRELGAHEKSIAAKTGDSAFALMSSEASEIAPGSNGMIFLPYMKGERSPLWNSEAKGVYYGLSYDKTRAHMIRSMMEGVAFSLKHNLDIAEKTGAKVTRLVSVGGASNSEVWTQIKADVTGYPIDVPYADHGTSLGSAILAGVGIGLYHDFDEAIARTVTINRSHNVNEDNERVYKKAYNMYIKLSDIFVSSIWEEN